MYQTKDGRKAENSSVWGTLESKREAYSAFCLRAVNRILADEQTKITTKRDINMLDSILFDFDGTLIEVIIDFSKMRREILALQPKYEVPINDKLYVLEMIDDAKKKIAKQDKQKALAFEQDAHDIVLSVEMEAANVAQPLPGTKKTLDVLKRRGIKIGIVTRNCRQVVEFVMGRTQLPYDVLLTRDDVEKVKPDPEHLLTALRLLRSEAQRTLMVGDHITDIIAGKAAGMKTAWLKRPNASPDSRDNISPDFVLPEVTKLLEIVSISPNNSP
ncbi:MAG: HAD family hydrolase [Candidatus Poribacteria bacterium]